MNLQVLISTVNADPRRLVRRMNLGSDAIIINQTDSVGYEEITFKGHCIQVWNLSENGIGLSRNNALMRATADILVFADDDEVFLDGYEKRILSEFEEHKESDFIVFNMDIEHCKESHRIPQGKSMHRTRVRWWNCLRYSTPRFAVRREVVLKNNLFFSLLYGASRYSHGEDSLFIQQSISKGLKVYTSAKIIAMNTNKDSSWFTGYDEKYFFDSGALMYALHRYSYPILCFVMIFRHRKAYCQNMGLIKVWQLFMRGAADAK